MPILVAVYGLISYTVAESTRELGIRMALGALKSDVLGMVLTRGFCSTFPRPIPSLL
jgi:ABC-type antimicrobial peptide transport system permease subunit